MIAYFLFVLAATTKSVDAWFFCDDGSVCPDGNVCCPTDDPGRSTCVSARLGDSACCEDDPVHKGMTGCASEFQCSRKNNGTVYDCEKKDKSVDDGLPERIPRYHLASLPALKLQNLYGFPVLKDEDDAPQLAYLSTQVALDTTQPEEIQRLNEVETLLVMVHGSARNVDDYLVCANEALPKGQQNPTNSTIMVVAPWFMSDADPTVQFTNRGNIDSIRWEENYHMIFHTWRYGADAYNANVSSYAVLDVLLDYVMKNRDDRFSSLRNLVIAGHSAGGQYTHRWALLTIHPSAIWDDPTFTRVVVANPRSFSYLDARRYLDNGQNFRLPDQNETDDCPYYNGWEWGLGDGGDMVAPYKDRALEEAGGTKALIDRYATRDVVYLAGEKDTIPLNDHCEEEMQGAYRFQRSDRFKASMTEVYGRPIHHRSVVPGVYHDHCLMFQSAEGFRALFGWYEDEKQTIA